MQSCLLLVPEILTIQQRKGLRNGGKHLCEKEILLSSKGIICYLQKAAYVVYWGCHCWTSEAGWLLQLLRDGIVDGLPKQGLLCRETIKCLVMGQKLESLNDSHDLTLNRAWVATHNSRINLLRKPLTGKCRKKDKRKSWPRWRHR